MSKKKIATRITVALAAVSLLAACTTGNGDVPSTPPTITGSTSPSAAETPTPTPTASKLPPLSKEELEEEMGEVEINEDDIVYQEESHLAGKDHPFLETPLFDMDPTSVFVPAAVKEAYPDTYQDIMRYFLAAQSDTISRSVLQDIPTEDNEGERELIIRGYERWFEPRVMAMIGDIMKHEDPNQRLVSMNAILAFVPSSEMVLPGDKYSYDEEFGLWDIELKNVKILGLDQKDNEGVIVGFTRIVDIPLVDKAGDNKIARMSYDEKWVFVPSSTGWKISVAYSKFEGMDIK